jgi:hypothetical protein
MAVNIKFNDIPYTGELAGVGPTYSAKGYTFHYAPATGEPYPTYFFVVNPEWRFNGRSPALLANSCTATTRLLADDNNPFNLKSIWLAALNGDEGGVVTFIGIKADNTLVRTNFLLARRLDDGGGIRAELVQRDPFVLHRDLRVEDLGMLALLPVRRRDGGVAVRQIERMQRVPGADARAIVEGARKLRVEADVGALAAVVPLAVVDETRVREHVLRIERRAPARMGQDRVGREAALLQIQHGPHGGLAVQGGRLHLAKVGMLVRSAFTREAIADEPLEAGQAGGGLAAERAHVPTRPFRPDLHEMAELPGEVLVDDEQAHAM